MSLGVIPQRINGYLFFTFEGGIIEKKIKENARAYVSENGFFLRIRSLPIWSINSDM